MSDAPRVPPTPPSDRSRAADPSAAFAPVYVPFGVHPRAAVVEALRRALVVAEAHPEGTRFVFEIHLGPP